MHVIDVDEFKWIVTLDCVRPGMREFLQDQGGRRAMAGLTTPIKKHRDRHPYIEYFED
jgi:hypothetical protein